MRFYVALAAIILAAQMMPCAASSAKSDCAQCLAATKAVASVVNQTQDVRVAPAETPPPEDSATASSGQPADEAAAQPNVCTTLIDAARANDLPPSFLARLIWQESRFDPFSVSPAGAKGIAQFMPQTATEVGLSDPYDPIEALPASARLLSRLHREFGNLGLAAAAYNAGSGRIRDWLAKRQSLPAETKHYVHIITGHSAESWTDDQTVLALPTLLPRGTPCREINADGQDPLPTKVALTTQMSDLLRRAKAEIATAARTRRMARNHRGRHGKDVVVAARHGRKTLAAHGSRKTRLADA
jgi:hypothetical protein